MIETLRWLDRLAHDLRGPLAPLQTAAYLLRAGQVEGERQQELFELIDRQTRQLVRMIDELGDWTRVSQGRLLGARERNDAAVLLDYALTNAGAAGAGCEVENHAEGALVEGDPARLAQLLRILIEYAGAHRAGAARITLHAVRDRLRIDADAGPAPDPARLQSLLDEPLAEPHDQGLGLRLLIARAIAEAHGGTLCAAADAGRLLLRCELPLATA